MGEYSNQISIHLIHSNILCRVEREGANYTKRVRDIIFYYLNLNQKINLSYAEKEKQKSTKPVIEVNSDTETLRRYEVRFSRDYTPQNV